MCEVNTGGAVQPSGQKRLRGRFRPGVTMSSWSLWRSLLFAAVVQLRVLPSAANVTANMPGTVSSFVRGCCPDKHVRVGLYKGQFSPLWEFNNASAIAGDTLDKEGGFTFEVFEVSLRSIKYCIGHVASS